MVARQILREYPSTSWLSNADTKINLDEVVVAVKAWLSRTNNTRWLIVFDNYDNPKLPENITVDIQKYLHKSYQGSIIITTRSSRVKIGHLIQIRRLRNIRDSLEILSNTSKREGLRSGKNVRVFCVTRASVREWGLSRTKVCSGAVGVLRVAISGSRQGIGRGRDLR